MEVTLIQDTLGARTVAKNQHRYGHNLNKSIHGREVWKLYRYHFVNGTPMPQINKVVMETFLARHPECWCRNLMTFKRWANKSVSGWNDYTPTPETVEKVNALLKEVFKTDDYSKYRVCKKIYQQVNGKKRLIAFEYIKTLYEKAYAKYVPLTPVNQWLPEYDDILMELYLDTLTGVYDHIERFNKKIKRRFPDWFIKQRLLDIDEKYIIKDKPLAELTGVEINEVRRNIVDFKKRGLTDSQILDKVRFYLKAEGYEYEVSDETLRELFN